MKKVSIAATMDEKTTLVTLHVHQDEMEGNIKIFIYMVESRSDASPVGRSFPTYTDGEIRNSFDDGITRVV